jgi:hypothetical protein
MLASLFVYHKPLAEDPMKHLVDDNRSPSNRRPVSSMGPLASGNRDARKYSFSGGWRQWWSRSGTRPEKDARESLLEDVDELPLKSAAVDGNIALAKVSQMVPLEDPSRLLRREESIASSVISDDTETRNYTKTLRLTSDQLVT